MKDWFRDNLKLSNRLIGSYDDKKEEYNITLKNILYTNKQATVNDDGSYSSTVDVVIAADQVGTVQQATNMNNFTPGEVTGSGPTGLGSGQSPSGGSDSGGGYQTK